VVEEDFHDGGVKVLTAENAEGAEVRREAEG
jgi:hypothetical protein